MRALAATVTFALAGCGVFEVPSIVLDLRVLAMVSEPPDQVVDVNLDNPVLTDVLGQLGPTQITAYVADPGKSRPLLWSMTLCLVDLEGRCDPSKPYKELGGGVIEDPELATSAQLPNAYLFPDQLYLQMLQRAVRDDPVQALGGVDVTALLRVRGLDEPPEADVLAAKKIRVVPKIPAGRTANSNPAIVELDSAIPGTGRSIDIVRRRCGDAATGLPTYLEAGETVTLFPIEKTAPPTREQYLAPTLDGQALMLEESISYQWLASAGSWSDETTGGGHDVLGNQSLLGSDWTAPRGAIPTAGYPVSIWMIQRDERLGVNVFETCIVVLP